MAEPSIYDIGRLTGLRRERAERELEEREAAGIPPPATPAEERQSRRSRYPMDPELVPAYIEQLPELTDISKLIPEADWVSQMSQAALNMTVPDPM